MKFIKKIVIILILCSLPTAAIAAGGGGQTGQAIVFDIPINQYGETAFNIPEGIPVTDAELLDGIKAEDENGEAVQVTVKDVGGLDMINPLPQMVGWMNTPYIITYAAQTKTGVEVTETRECYVTLGIKAAAGTPVGDFSSLKNAVETAAGPDLEIEITSDIIFTDTITISDDIEITFTSDLVGTPRILSAGAAVTNMFTILGSGSPPSDIDVTLKFTDIILDGNNQSRAILFGINHLSNPSKGSFTIDGAVIQNCKAEDDPTYPSTGNSYGGGIYAFTADGGITIKNTEVKDCASIGVFQAYGGGVYCSLNGTLTIDGMRLLRNEAAATANADAISFGGGLCVAHIYGTTKAAVSITNSEISGNFSHTPNCDSYGLGGGIFHDDLTTAAANDEFSIANSVFSDNWAEMGYFFDPLPSIGGFDWAAWHFDNVENIGTTTYTVPFKNALSGYDVYFECVGHKAIFDYKDAAVSNRGFLVYTGAHLPPLINILWPPTKSTMTPVSWADENSVNNVFDFAVTAIERDYTFVPAMKFSGGGGGGGGSYVSTVLTIEGVDENGKVIYSKTESANSGQAKTVKAPVISGYTLNDDGEKTITIKSGSNKVIFKYKAETAPPKLEMENHIPYLSGYPDGRVSPDGNITRAEAAAIFFRLITDADKNIPLTSSFSDMKSGVWYNQAVAYLEKSDIVSGYPDGSFEPQGPITRAEFAAVASRFDKLETGAPNNFLDVPDNYWAAGYITGAAAKGWASGFPDGTFRPNGYITRAQVVAIINRMLERKIELSDIPEGANKFIDIDAVHWAYCDIVEASVEHEYTRKENGCEIWR